jgi:tRNA threonylcarbamoyladenosine biosynthesis protein TsaB
MNILALDTCFGACSVAVRCGVPGAPPREFGERALMATGHAEALVPMIARVLGEARLEARALQRIAVTHGPGSFTGTRIAIAVARGLALATGAVVVPFSGLMPIGRAAWRRIEGDSGRDAAVLVVMDARNRQHYVQIIGADGRELTPPMLCDGDAAARLAPDLELHAIGTGAADVIAAAHRAGRRIDVIAAPTPACHQPDAAELLEPAAQTTPGAAAPAPLYLRPPDAKPPASPAIPRAGV